MITTYHNAAKLLSKIDHNRKVILRQRHCFEFNKVHELVLQGFQAWRVSHWEVGEVAALAMPTGEEVDPAATDIDDDQGEEEGMQEAARNTLAVLRSGRPLTDEDVMGYQNLINSFDASHLNTCLTFVSYL